MKKKNKEVAKSTGIELFIQAIQSGVENYGSHLIESSGADVAKQILGDVALETGASIVPIVGNAISSYRVNKKLYNLEEFIHLIASRLDSFIERLDVASLSDKEKYSELFDFAYDSVGSYSQKEKINLLVNGLETIVMTDDISFDIAYLYINTLNRLTLLDISVLKLYSSLIYYDSREERGTYQDVLDKYGITLEQYKSIQSNLNIIGLLDKKTDQTLEKDLNELVDHINRIDSNFKIISSDLKLMIDPKKNVKRLSTLKTKNVKLNAKDRYVISKFGKDFYKYFLKNN